LTIEALYPFRSNYAKMIFDLPTFIESSVLP